MLFFESLIFFSRSATPLGCTLYVTYKGSPTTTLPAWIALIIFDTTIFLLTLLQALYHCESGALCVV